MAFRIPYAISKLMCQKVCDATLFARLFPREPLFRAMLRQLGHVQRETGGVKRSVCSNSGNYRVFPERHALKVVGMYADKLAREKKQAVVKYFTKKISS